MAKNNKIPRGRLIDELVDKFGMVVLNIGVGADTYVCRTGELSNLDVTVMTRNIASRNSYTEMVVSSCRLERLQNHVQCLDDARCDKG